MPLISPWRAKKTLVPTVNPTKNKQQLARRKLQEGICFYKVDMERADLFCWKWLSSSLSLSLGLAPGRFVAWLVEWRKEAAWLWTGSTGSLKPWQLTDTTVLQSPCWRQSPTDHKTRVRLSNKHSAHCHSILDHHHGKHLVCTCVYHKQMPHFSCILK